MKAATFVKLFVYYVIFQRQGFTKRFEACTRVFPRIQKQTYNTTKQNNKRSKPQYTTDRYTATVNIKYTDNDIKHAFASI